MCGTHRDGTPACTKQVSSARSPGAAGWIANVWNVLQSLTSALSATDSWQLLVFLETRALVLGGQTPRAALEQGVEAHRILALALATAEAH